MSLPTDVASFKTSVKNKMNFMQKAFIAPYFEDAQSAELLTAFGVGEDVSINEGILRVNYSSSAINETEAVTEAAGMNAIFNGALTKLDHTVLASLNESSYVPEKGYTIYEYSGSLYVPEASSYTFTANTSGQMEVYINYTNQLSQYGGANPNTPITNTTPVPLEMGVAPINIRFFQRSAAGAPQSFHLQWRKSSDPVASNATLGCANLYYDSTLLTRASPENASFNKDALIDNLLDYSAFKQYFGAQSQALTTALTNPVTYGGIQVAVDSSNYTAFTCSAAPSVIPTGDLTNDGKVNGDINYYTLLNTTLQPIANGNALNDLLTFINDIRKVYNALDDVAYERIKNNEPSVPVNTYQIDPTTNRPMTVEGNTVLPSNVLALFEKVTPVERFVFRRLILLVDLLIHANIAMFLFESVYNNAAILCQTKLTDMLGHFITRIKTLNERYDRIFQSPNGQSANLENEIMANLYENIHAFQNNSATMGKLSKDFKESKTTLKANLRLMESEKDLYGSGNKWTMAFLIITVIVVLTVVAYSILSQAKPEYKWIGAATVSATSALTVLLFYLIKSKKMEQFTTGDVYNPVSWRDAIATARAIDIIRDAYQYDMMREIQAYIQNTIHMALILQNSKTYSYINHTMQKEINYYTASKQQVDNAKTLAKASTRMYNLETRNNLSRVNVYIALIVILTFAIVGYRLSGDSIILQYTVLIVASVLLLIVALLYIIDVERKVRTDGRKIYWGQPNDMLAKL